MSLPPPQCVLVTGGAGYVGSHAALELLRAGHQVIIVDTLERSSGEAIERLRRIGDIEFIQGDCGDPEIVAQPLSRADTVMHFAAYARVEESIECPERYQHNNVEVTRSLLKSAIKAGVSRFIFSSTCAVYGSPGPEHLPVTENAPMDPQNPYGDTKVQAEAVLAAASAPHPFATGVLRYFNVIGADADGALAEPVVEARLLCACLQAARGERDHFTINGTDYDTPDGTAVRDFVHVTDIAGAHGSLMTALEDGQHLVCNVGCGHGTSVRDIVQAVEAVCGHPISVVEGPRRPGDIPATWADTTRIRETLNWSPRYDDIAAMVSTSWNADRA
ncbi:MAG: UDP-glucose 4-epimerase GalE [Phycisphaerales bacterium]|nr:UDP-glucose 4-epimerase GalE [Phycisphaerales bacterium]